MERRFLSEQAAGITLVERAEGENPTISGHAAVFFDGTEGTEFRLWDGAVERVMPGAFDGALSRGDDARGLFNHDPNQVLGRRSAGTVNLSVDAKGLRYNIDPPDTSVASDVVALIRRGDIQGSSFSFQVTDQEWRTENKVDIREIRGVELFDVGPVTFPAYENTTTGVRSQGADAEARSSWEAFKAGQAADAEKLAGQLKGYRDRADEVGA